MTARTSRKHTDAPAAPTVIEGELVDASVDTRPLAAPPKRNTQTVAYRGVRERLATARAPRAHVRQPMTAFSSLLAAASLLHAAGVYWGFVMAVCVAGTLAAALVTGFRTYKVGWYVILAGMIGGFATGWLTWTAATTPWSVPALTALLVGVSCLGSAYGYSRWKIDNAVQEQQIAEAVAAEKAERKRHEFVQVLLEAGVKDTDVAWDDRTDDRWMLGLALGKGAPTFKSLRMACEEIEKATARQLDLPITIGSIQLAEAESRRPDRAVLIIPTANYMERKIPVPLERLTGARSIYEPVDTGLNLLGDVMEQILPGTHGLISGMTNHGKSMFLDNHTKDTVRCPDAVTFLVSGEKGIRFTRPWLFPWLNGETHRPPVDWIAIDIDEALMMLSDLYRTVACRQKMPGAGHAGWRSTPEHPQIVVNIDEATDFLDHGKKIKTHTGQTMTFSDLVLKLFRLGRSEGITVLLSSQRNTNSLLGEKAGDIKSQILYRAMFRTQSSQELSNMFTGSTAGLNAGKLPPGCNFLQLSQGSGDPILAKSYFLTEEDIHHYARQGAEYSGVLDEYTAGHMEHYAGRWSRMGQQQILADMCNGAVPNHISAVLGTVQTIEPTSTPDTDFVTPEGPAGGDSYGLGGAAVDRLRKLASGEVQLGSEKPAAEREPDWVPDNAFLEAMLNAPAIDETERNRPALTDTPTSQVAPKLEEATDPQAVVDCRELLTALHRARVLDTDANDAVPGMVPVSILLEVAAGALGWSNNSSGAQRVAAALGAVGIKRKRVTKQNVTSYPRDAMLEVYHQLHHDG